MTRHVKHFFHALLLVASVLGLSACATKPAPMTEWETHEQTLLDITQFTAKGKVAFISPAQRVSANFVWEQNGDAMSLRLTNFLGSTLLKLEATPKGAILVDNEGQRYIGKDAASLLQKLTGIALPVNDMTQWIKGLPAETNDFTLGADNRLAFLSENDASTNKPGWQLDYQTYDAATDSLLPAKIKMNQNDQKVNLVISNWKYAQ
ncbi:lipoprotein insertase outer membrane protein LolB [Enterovibrio norvegicus]|uniref:lipoprotein insertase outer membrane protein LolB n=1 Tax=Enterovibrio norvegicus TaxID=188144 RepID=UPI000C82A596|nr:lipoprotein insertase outer membrane protein LolB [Enterovibrio norvegicus]PML76492.1 outer membrane lipoprotein LolB [Enterovibrio norvegicus]